MARRENESIWKRYKYDLDECEDLARMDIWEPPTKLMEEGLLYTKPKDMARVMNNYFVNKVKNLRDNLVPNPGDPLVLIRRLMANRKCSMTLKCVHPDLVLKVISTMKSSSS